VKIVRYKIGCAIAASLLVMSFYWYYLQLFDPTSFLESNPSGVTTSISLISVNSYHPNESDIEIRLNTQKLREFYDFLTKVILPLLGANIAICAGVINISNKLTPLSHLSQNIQRTGYVLIGLCLLLLFKDILLFVKGYYFALTSHESIIGEYTWETGIQFLNERYPVILELS
jgi:hypothetical protein